MVSVVLSSYNGEKFIAEQLSSILCQTVCADEVIICDDCSTDNTEKIICDFINEHNCNGWHFFKNEKNVGFCLNFYGGIQRASGDIIFLCDQDDVWEENKIEVMTRVMHENPDIYALASRYSVIDKDSKVITDSKIPYLGEVFDGSIEQVSVDSLIGCSHIRGFSMCFKSEIKKYLKPIDLKSTLAHDWFINILAAMLSKCCILNTKLCRYRHHGENTSLSAMDRKTLIGSLEKRIRGLEESVEAHEYVLSLNMVSDNQKKAFQRLIKCEKARLKFLNNKNIFLWLSLLKYMGCYKRYYKSAKGALRVYFGDFLYAYEINFKVK